MAAVAFACALAFPALADTFKPGGVSCDARYPQTCDVRGWHPERRPSAGRAVDGALRAMVTAAAYAAGVPGALAHAVVKVESGYRPDLRGAAGEWGLGQIKCQTARGVGFAGGCGELARPEVNLRYSMAYLRLALDKGGRSCAGLSLYNRGIGGHPRCTAYGRRVLASASGSG